MRRSRMQVSSAPQPVLFSLHLLFSQFTPISPFPEPLSAFWVRAIPSHTILYLSWVVHELFPVCSACLSNWTVSALKAKTGAFSLLCSIQWEISVQKGERSQSWRNAEKVIFPSPLSLPPQELYGLISQRLVYSNLGVENLFMYTPLALSTPCAGKSTMTSLGECAAKKEEENGHKHSRKVDLSYFMK